MLINVTVNGKVAQYEHGTSFADIVKDYPDPLGDDILLVNKNGKLCELHKKLNRDCTLNMITARDRPGIQTYERSAVLLMLKAFYDVVGAANIEKVNVEFSIGNGLYIRALGQFVLDEKLLNNVKIKMREMVDAEIPIMKKSVSTSDAVEMFHRHKMFDKEKLFRYRRVSKVNIYSLAGFEDYFYGYMVINTSYIKYFDLIPFHDGFVLSVPKMSEPKSLPEFIPSIKVFDKLISATLVAEKLGLANVGSLNETISEGRTNEMIVIQEAMMEKQIGDIAENIIADTGKRIIMIAGPSSSGKTTFSHRLSAQLWAGGKKPHPIEVDNYFKNRIDTPKDESGAYDFEAIEALDTDLFNRDMEALLDGKTIEIPHFNFKKGEREYTGEKLSLGPDDILVIEGIHCLNDNLSCSLPKQSQYKIYISALTQMNIDEHNRISTTDGRLIRRIVRDARTRGTGAIGTIKMWQSVRRGEEKNIFPFQDQADVVFNSALIYELALLKQYAEPLLFGIDQDCEEYVEAKKLLKFLDYFIGIPGDNVPKNSIIREFIGGSCFKV